MTEHFGVTNPQSSQRSFSHIVNCAADNSTQSASAANNSNAAICSTPNDVVVGMETTNRNELPEPRSFLSDVSDDLRDPSVQKAVAVELMAQVCSLRPIVAATVLPQSSMRLGHEL